MKRDDEMNLQGKRFSRYTFFTILLLMLLTLFVFLSGCGSRVELSEEQQNVIDIVMSNKQIWKSYHKYGNDQNLCNLVYIWEDGENNICFSSGYSNQINEGMTGSGVKITAVSALMNCYVIDGNELEEISFTQDDRYQWMKNGSPIDQKNMSDEEIRAALEESYICFLSNKP